jgi:ABC-type transport system substrate-binding protein
MNSSSFNSAPTVSAGIFQFAERLPGEEIRLKTADGALAFVYRDIQGMNETQFFRTGHGNVLVNPPLDMRDDLAADPELNVTQLPGNTWNFIAMNVADPNLSRSAADGTGKLLEQGHHPIFGDVRVRQAIQKAIDVNQLINTAVLSYGLPLLSSHVPGSWAANDNLPAITYDRDAADALLTQAGWIDHNADGVRECDGCLYALQGSPLYFDLLVATGGGRDVAANLISRQLNQLGVGVNVNVLDESSLLDQVRYQQFDAYMDGQTEDFPTDGDQSSLFTRTGDVLYQDGNNGSYTNPDIEKLMKQALTLPGCDANARADIYRSAQGILQTDQPYIWLYASKAMLVTRGIIGAAPYPNRPFWNIQDWIVAS